MAIFYRVHMDATDDSGMNTADFETAIKLMHDFNEAREPGDESWRWAYIEKIEENVLDTIRQN